MAAYAAYSYRNDPHVPDFGDVKPLIIFDGKCVLCSSGVQWMLARDPNSDTIFAAIQETIPKALYEHYELDADAFDTFMVLNKGRPHLRWRGVCEAARIMPWPWRWLGQAGRIVPTFIGDAVYDWVQRNRIGWFGATETCFTPDPAIRGRFLNG
ncbi:MAG: DCC1-like thiol-disulfide oxidoreductase family protein [Pseudomonadota bacterium]